MAMSLATTGVAEGQFRIGDVIGKTLAVLLRNLPPIIVVFGIAILPDLLILGQLGVRGAVIWRFPWAYAAPTLVRLMFSLGEASIAYGVIEQLHNRRLGVMSSIRFAKYRLRPVAGISLLITAAIYLPSTILFGIANVTPTSYVVRSLLTFFMWLVIGTIWPVAIPACVLEHLGPWKSFKRSAELAKGHRWKIFGIFMVSAIIFEAGAALIGVAVAMFGLTTWLVASMIWRTLFNAFSAVLAIVVYHHLRIAREGVDTDQIAAVFE
jgi:hypothetical protein